MGSPSSIWELCFYSHPIAHALLVSACVQAVLPRGPLGSTPRLNQPASLAALLTAARLGLWPAVSSRQCLLSTRGSSTDARQCTDVSVGHTNASRGLSSISAA